MVGMEATPSLGGGGSDWVTFFENSSAVTIDLQNQKAFGGGYVDALVSIENADGSIFADLIYGSSADNALTGGEGMDTIYGGEGMIPSQVNRWVRLLLVITLTEEMVTMF
jgi:hypothetical protein